MRFEARGIITITYNYFLKYKSKTFYITLSLFALFSWLSIKISFLDRLRLLLISQYHDLDVFITLTNLLERQVVEIEFQVQVYTECH